MKDRPDGTRHVYAAAMRSVLSLVLFVSVAGCYRSHSPAPCAIEAASRPVSETSSDTVDLLFVIDDSRSMELFQSTLRREFPRLVTGILTGDHDADPRTPPYARVTSLRVGVVTTDMGELGISTYPDDVAAFGCYGPGATIPQLHYGTDGLMVRTARGADTPNNHTGLDCDFDGDGRADSVSAEALPDYFTFDAVADAPTSAEVSSFVTRVSCFGLVGIGGCGSEMPFESMLKALTPRASPIRFHTAPGDSGDLGHGDDPSGNAGWLRPDSLLAVIVLTDEDDCSGGDRRVYDWGAAAPFADPANPNPGDRDSPYRAAPFQRGTRCLRFADALHPIERYVDGLLALRSDPSRVVFAAITGVPADTVDDVEAGEGETNLGALLDDPRLEYAYLPDESGRPLARAQTTCGRCDPSDPECSTDVPVEATPARRVVMLAQALEARGAHAIVQSICEPSYTGAVQRILSTLGTAIAPTCLPYDLPRTPEGLVGCIVTQRLPSGQRCADSDAKGLEPTPLRLDATGREVCRMRQLAVSSSSSAPPAGTGWYLDESSALAARCGAPGRRLTFSGDAALDSDADTRVECVMPRLNPPRTRDIGAMCDYGSAASCALSTTDSEEFRRRYELDAISRTPGLPNLRCEAATATCQLPCLESRDCPLGTACVDPDGPGGRFYFPRCVSIACER